MRVESHGTVSEYNNHGCRCPECKAAQAEYARKRRQAKPKLAIAEHGFGLKVFVPQLNGWFEVGAKVD